MKFITGILAFAGAMFLALSALLHMGLNGVAAALMILF